MIRVIGEKESGPGWGMDQLGGCICLGKVNFANPMPVFALLTFLLFVEMTNCKFAVLPIPIKADLSTLILGKGLNKKKSREFSLTGGGGLTPIPYLFYFLFCKRMYKRMLSDSAFLGAFRGPD